MSRRAAAASLRAFAALCLAALGASSARAATAWSLVPQPAEARLAAAPPLRVGDGAAIRVRGADRTQVPRIVDLFVQRVAATRGLHLQVAAADEAHAAITFALDPRADVAGDAGYRIAVDERGIAAVARTPQGLFYASVTVWQLLTQPGWTRGAPADVAAGTIVDHPRFAWRALLLDSGRHFQSVAEIEQLIDWMSLDKLNVLVWHLTEDQGWRIEIPAFPELTRVGACRKAVGLDIELTGAADKPYCGFYTAEQIREIVQYAAERFVTVVPDLDLPGHSQAAVASYPWLGVSGARPSVWSAWGVSPWLLKPDARTLHFVDAVLDEVMRLFPSKYVSIGGDEAAKDQWNASPAVRAQMRKLGLAGMDQLQGWFTQQVADYLVRHGRTPLGWDDELVAGAKLPAAEVVMSWHGSEHGRVAREALRQGHAVIVTPQESLYFDHYQSDLPDEWSGQAPMSTLEQTYRTAIVPQGATTAQEARILGVQACLWTELMPTFADDQHAVFPRLAALADLAWSPASAHDWNGFVERLPGELGRYRALGIGYADSAFAPAIALSGTADGKLRAAISTQIRFGTVRYTTDGSTPTAASTPYSEMLEFPAHAAITLRAAAFAPDGFALSAPRTQTVDAAAPRRRRGSELSSCAHPAEAMRLHGTRTAQGAVPTYKADIGNMCWRWPHAPLDGVSRIAVAVERAAWQFGDDAANAVVRPKTAATGEVEFHLDACDGPLLASVALPPAPPAPAPTTLLAALSTSIQGSRDVCIVATGDPRDGQWMLATLALGAGDLP